MGMGSNPQYIMVCVRRQERVFCVITSNYVVVGVLSFSDSAKSPSPTELELWSTPT